MVEEGEGKLLFSEQRGGQGRGRGRQEEDQRHQTDFSLHTQVENKTLWNVEFH